MGRFCTNCGKPVTGNFCANCGAPTQSEAPAQVDTESPSSKKPSPTLNGVEVDMDYLLIEFRTKFGIDKIGLIKKVRELTGADLGESKDFVEAHCAHVEAKGVPTTGRVQDMNFPTVEDRKLSEKTGFIVLMFALFWPVGLYLLFTNKHYSTSTKLSGLVFFIAFIIVCLICASTQTP